VRRSILKRGERTTIRGNLRIYIEHADWGGKDWGEAVFTRNPGGGTRGPRSVKSEDESKKEKRLNERGKQVAQRG